MPDEAPSVRTLLGRFIWLWLPALLILIAGLAAAWRTGQADPWDWAVPALIVLIAAGLVGRRAAWPVLGWAGLGSIGTVLIFCGLASARVPLVWPAIGFGAVVLLSVFSGAMVLRPGLARLAGGGMVALALVLLWRGPAQPLVPPADRPPLAVVTALPLFWAETGAGRAGMTPRDAPIVTILRARFRVQPLDDLATLRLDRTRRLLLAQPRALSGEALVALDRWVRGGGTVLVLADPLLRWPGLLPLGDRRRAPVTHGLDRLLAHWGFTPPQAVPGPEIRHFLSDGGLVTLSGADFYRPGQPVARRQVGQGTVILLGDADAMDDRLWLADPARPLDPRLWVADTPGLVLGWLGAADVPSGRRWMRQGDDVIGGLRWAILFGTGWAILGVMLIGRGKGRLRWRTKRETRSAKEQQGTNSRS